MADNEVKIKISVNSEEAQAKFRELKEQIERIYGSGGGSSGGGGGSNNSNSVNNSGDLGSVKDQGKEFGQSAGNEITKISRNMGYMVGMQIVNLVSKVLQDNIEYDYLTKVHAGQDPWRAQKEKEQSSTSLNYAGVYGSIGMMMGGPWGALAGALGGALYGHWNAGRMADEKQRIKFEEYKYGHEMTAEMAQINLGRNIGRSALQRRLSLAGDREEELAILREAHEQVQSGDGPNSLMNLLAKRDEMQYGNQAYQDAKWVLEHEDSYSSEEVRNAKFGYGKYAHQVKPSWDTESKEAKILTDKINFATQTQAELKMQEWQVENLKQYVKPWDGHDFSDSFSAKGLYAGAQIDMSRANEPIVNELIKMNQKMEAYMHGMTDGAGSANRDAPEQPQLRAAAVIVP